LKDLVLKAGEYNNILWKNVYQNSLYDEDRPIPIQELANNLYIEAVNYRY